MSMLTSMSCCGAGEQDALKQEVRLEAQEWDRSTAEGASSNPDTEEEEEQETQDSASGEQRVRDTVGVSAGWWAEADLGTAQGFAGVASASKLLDAQVVRLARVAPEPWLPGQCEDRYRQLGAQKPGGLYVASWLGIEDKSLVFLSEVSDRRLFEDCIAGNFMKDRLKFILNPVKVKIPVPSKGPATADTVGAFFGRSATDSFRSTLPSGADVVSIRIDIFSKWVVKIAIKQCGFRKDNVVELLLVDWQNRAALASIRIVVTDEFLAMLA
jgi:hypothetical protein